MIKKAIFTFLFFCLALSANAQIATPQLDAGFNTYGGAAAGWRYGSTVGFAGVTAEGKAEVNGKESGDVTYGLNAKGPNDSSNPLPFGLAAFRGESFAGELYTNIGDGLKSDIEIQVGASEEKYLIEEKELRVGLAYVFGESLSIGLGYSSLNTIFQEDKAFSNEENTEDKTETGTSITASIRLAEVFYIAGGYEMVKQVGTYRKKDASGDNEMDLVENSWNNTMWAVALVLGDPGATQFRVEYGQIVSPESFEEAESGRTEEHESRHHQITTSFTSVEAKFGGFLIGYYHEKEIWDELKNEEREIEQTSYGIGWQPSEGLTVSLYSLDTTTTVNNSEGSDSKFPGTGYRFFVGYNF